MNKRKLRLKININIKEDGLNKKCAVIHRARISKTKNQISLNVIDVPHIAFIDQHVYIAKSNLFV